MTKFKDLDREQKDLITKVLKPRPNGGATVDLNFYFNTPRGKILIERLVERERNNEQA